MGTPVKLSEIMEAMEWLPDEASSFLNRKTGEIIGVSDEEFRIAEEEQPQEEYPEWQRELIAIAREILEDEENKFIPLPSRFEIDEYSMMERFVLSVNDEEIFDSLYAAIKGKGAFRRFSNGIRRFGIEGDWERYRKEKFKELAIEWCEDNNIDYIDDL
ncbi:MAG: UPF0158 family protein [Candidatus Zixiibacteriota bacterium]